jgi:tRNA (mo5U34)-methyltransferase
MARVGANDPSTRSHWRDLAKDFSQGGWYHSIELPDGQVLQGLLSIEQQKRRLEYFPLPEDLSGKRVLDIGTWDGWYAFETERRGAEVMAIDNVEQPAFHLARDRIGSKVEYRVMSVYDVSPDTVGRFDIVLFFGVLYHLKHPVLGLEKVCSVTKDMAFVESYVTDEALGGPTVMEFYETDELATQLDNWVGPTAECLLALCRTAGFARVGMSEIVEQRAHVVCRRRWETESEGLTAAAPRIDRAVDGLTHVRTISSNRDDYLTAWFDSEEDELGVADVFPEVAGYGIRPLYVTQAAGGAWQVDFMVPKGIDPGKHEIRIRTTNSPYSEPAEIYIDEEEPIPKPDSLELAGVADAKTFDAGRTVFSEEMWVSLWLRGLPEGVRREHLKVLLGSAPLPIDFLSSRDEEGLQQLNVRLPPSSIPGRYRVAVRCGRVSSGRLDLEVVAP